jgi:glyoxylase-like metal-dependent hydrolase (beta-lactamase superfamily II)
LVEAGADAVAPAAELNLLTNVTTFWESWRQKRFHDYAQQTTKVLTRPLAVARPVRGGDTFDWHGLKFEVLDTPGYTRGSVSYLVTMGGRRIAFTGDLIYGDGQLLDLYSLQDAIPKANSRGYAIRGYHGYAARLADVVQSLHRLAARKPDLIIPARGPVIEDPAEAIQRLLDRIAAFYPNYLSLDALRWYFGDEHILAKARRVLGPDAPVDWLPMAETNALPDWVIAIGNTRVIRAADGAGFLIDCGSQSILNQLKQLRKQGELRSLEHLYITHYHNDHTDWAPEAIQTFGATVYACPELADILERPAAYRMPAMTDRPIPVTARVRSGASWRWKEFRFTLYYFPGQTLYHQALLAQKDDGESIFFIGDSFSPTGIDDYCLQNRNFLHADQGYFYCLDLVEQMPPGCFLVNEHIKPRFRFSAAQIARMRRTLKERLVLLRKLTPWSDRNFALDDGWACFRAYGVTTRTGGTVTGAVVLLNHAPKLAPFRVRLNLPTGWELVEQSPLPVRIPPHQEGVVHFRLRVPDDAPAGLTVLTADIEAPDRVLREWCELMVEVAPPSEGRSAATP